MLLKEVYYLKFRRNQGIWNFVGLGEVLTYLGDGERYRVREELGSCRYCCCGGEQLGGGVCDSVGSEMYMLGFVDEGFVRRFSFVRKSQILGEMEIVLVGSLVLRLTDVRLFIIKCVRIGQNIFFVISLGFIFWVKRSSLRGQNVFLWELGGSFLFCRWVDGDLDLQRRGGYIFVEIILGQDWSQMFGFVLRVFVLYLFFNIGFYFVFVQWLLFGRGRVSLRYF